MGVPLAHPPLIEALVEFRFSKETEWDWTIPGRVFDRLRKDFPDRQEVRPPVLLVQPAQGPLGSHPVPAGAPERLQFKRQDGSAMIQVGPRLLVVNHLRPYPNWELFRDLVVGIFRIHWEILGKGNLERIGMRYINQIPANDLDPDNDLRVVAPVGKIFNTKPVQFYQRYNLSLDGPAGTLIHQCGLASVNNSPVIMLDLDYFSSDPKDIDDEALPHWLNAAHEHIESAFIKSLSEQLFGKLKGAERHDGGNGL